MNESQLKGKIFEKLIKTYLEKQGYVVIPEKIRNYYGVRKEHHGLTVKGRGPWHQIDALGQFQFQIPFVYPLRLLCEAKCRVRPIGLSVVRDFMGVLKDISENYFIENIKDLKYKDRFRFTDSGAIFSMSNFTEDAQTYAYAQGICLVQTKELLPLVEAIVKKIELEHRNKNTGHRHRNLDASIKRFISESEKDTFCYFGIASGIYPLVIVSDRGLPLEKFIEDDGIDVKMHYKYAEIGEEKREIYGFRIEFDNWSGTFHLPGYVWEQYINRPDFKEAMLDMKEKILDYIDIPLKIRNIRRIIRFNLDKPWIRAVKESLGPA